MARKSPARLAEKLLKIRTDLGYSQRGLIRALQMQDEISQAEISMYESGKRLPNLLVLRKYALIAGIWTDYLIEDALELPKIPAKMNVI